MHTIVIDTNVFVAALRVGGARPKPARELLRAVLAGRYLPLFGNALWMEYLDLLGRPEVWTSQTTPSERMNMLAALAAKSVWTTVYYGWRPNLPDEGDNHLIELAVAGQAEAIVTYNKKDIAAGQIVWPEIKILTPKQCLETLV